MSAPKEKARKGKARKTHEAWSDELLLDMFAAHERASGDVDLVPVDGAAAKAMVEACQQAETDPQWLYSHMLAHFAAEIPLLSLDERRWVYVRYFRLKFGVSLTKAQHLAAKHFGVSFQAIKDTCYRMRKKRDL
jgi:hypothetical protein